MIDFCSPCLFGLEGLLAAELRRLNMKNVNSENGRVRFSGDFIDIARANHSVRFGERILIELGSFEASSFDELFCGVNTLPWEDYIPVDAAFPVKGHAINSKLHSIPDCQKIIKKAVVERLRAKHGQERLSEEKEKYQIQFSIIKDMAALYIDTSGDGLHKRGYRPEGGIAPLRETLAAAIVEIARYRGREDFCDPFCGSGTIVIEAALLAKNRAPGLNRHFAAEKWRSLPGDIWQLSADEARAGEFSSEYRIFGSDIDPGIIETAKNNARRAGVQDIITFDVADARNFSRKTDSGIIAANPPYGERLSEKTQAEELYREFGRAVRPLPGWRKLILTSHPEFERFFGSRADKKRKLYNGMIKCDLFIYN